MLEKISSSFGFTAVIKEPLVDPALRSVVAPYFLHDHSVTTTDNSSIGPLLHTACLLAFSLPRGYAAKLFWSFLPPPVSFRSSENPFTCPVSHQRYPCCDEATRTLALSCQLNNKHGQYCSIRYWSSGLHAAMSQTLSRSSVMKDGVVILVSRPIPGVGNSRLLSGCCSLYYLKWNLTVCTFAERFCAALWGFGTSEHPVSADVVDSGFEIDGWF